jgi:hypothetical protein
MLDLADVGLLLHLLDRLSPVRDLHQLGCAGLTDSDLVPKQSFPFGPTAAVVLFQRL